MTGRLTGGTAARAVVVVVIAGLLLLLLLLLEGSGEAGAVISVCASGENDGRIRECGEANVTAEGAAHVGEGALQAAAYDCRRQPLCRDVVLVVVAVTHVFFCKVLCCCCCCSQTAVPVRCLWSVVLWCVVAVCCRWEKMSYDEAGA